ncbi:MAG: 3'(2'),5'-bisphosphate nucleotidase CysQ [Cypionkella sp.]
MQAHDLGLLTDAARAAGEIALRYWNNAPRVWEKGDQGPVTEADIAVNDMLKSILRSARPSYGWLSEETPDDGARLQCDYVFIIDPIDGTRAFIAGERNFSHSLAVAYRGRVIAGAVYLPAKDQLFTASLDGPALCDGMPITPSRLLLADDPKILTPKANLDSDFWQGTPPVFRRSFRTSLAYRLCLVAEGRHDGMMSFRNTWEWDIAAGSLIAARAGATVTDGRGQPLLFNNASPHTPGVLAAGPALHSELLARLKA